VLNARLAWLHVLWLAGVTSLYALQWQRDRPPYALLDAHSSVKYTLIHILPWL
jgi:hypothetical protein